MEDFKIERIKPSIYGIFSKCHNKNKKIAFDVVKVLYDIRVPLSHSDLIKIIKTKSVYNIINRLEENQIIIRTEGSKKKMLVDNGVSSEPAYGRDAIQQMKFNNYNKLLQDGEDRYIIKQIIIKHTQQINLTGFLNHNNFIKIYNKIVEEIADNKLYDKSNGYGKLDWRPQKVSKYKLDHKHIEDLLSNRIQSIITAIKKVKTT